MEQVEALAEALTAVIQRSGRREVARAVVERLANYVSAGGVGDADTQSDARRRLDLAEEDVRSGMARVRTELAAVLRSQGGGQGGGAGTEDLEAIRARLDQLERGLGNRPPSPTALPFPRPPFPPPLDKAKGKALPEEEEDGEISVTSTTSRRGRARALLDQVLLRLGEVEDKAENAMLGYQEVADDLSVLDSDVIFQSDRIDELNRFVHGRRRRPGEVAKADEPAQSETGEADMEIDEDREGEEGEIQEGDSQQQAIQPGVALPRPVDPGSAASPKPVYTAPAGPSSGIPGLGDEIERLREQMTAMEQRLNAMQGISSAPPTADVTDVDMPDADMPTAEGPAPHRESSQPPSEAPPAPPAPSGTLDDLHQTIKQMSKQLESLEARVDGFTKAELQALLEAERAHVQTTVQNLLDSQVHEIIAAASADALAKLDEQIARTVPVIVAREIRALAAKSANLRSKGGRQSPTPQSRTVPLQQRLSVPGPNFDRFREHAAQIQARKTQQSTTASTQHPPLIPTPPKY
ncbi:hypothetical protein CspeluHIS016_0114420 [Cutaneotrichosporon spelunceum]|uniref:Uncharacterized protein n=1 Tax=Cutaneotrichosporon spelunceum TaxID=1672016 RepID=A0AAD3TQU4_9TREE|nr:hypothetical protein CspeluHIS016_0114420 [Cutaneotrichosporon spelunceum]